MSEQDKEQNITLEPTEELEDKPTTNQSVGKKIAKATGALVVVQLFLRLFGIIENMVLAQTVSLSNIEIYLLAKRVTSPILALGDQVIMHSFLPAFVQKLESEGEGKAWRLASTVINLMLIIMLTVGAIGIIFTPQFLGIFFQSLPENIHGIPQFLSQIINANWQNDPEITANIPLTLKITKLFLVAMIFLAISSITYCLLNSYKQFALPASSDLVLKISTLAIGLLLVGKIGVIAFALGFIIGALGKLLTQVIGLRITRAGQPQAKYTLAIDVKDKAFKSFLILAVPLLIGWAFSTFRVILESYFLNQASQMTEGALTSFDFAKKICDIPVSVFPYVFGIALFPFLTDIAQNGEKSKLREMLTTATKIMLLIFIPLAIAIYFFRERLISVVYASENFTEQAVAMTSDTLALYAFVMIFAALEIIVNQFFFANKDTLRPTVTGICCLPFYAVIAYLGVFHFNLGAVGVVIAVLSYRTLKVISLYTMVRKKTDGLPVRPFLSLLGKIVVSLVPFVAICLLTLNIDAINITVHAAGAKDKIKILLPYMISGCFAFLTYFIALYLLKTPELIFLVNKIRKRV